MDKHGQPVHQDTVQTVDFNHIGTKDKVTNTISWNPWTPTGQTLTAVVPPTISGYIPDTKLVPAKTVTDETPDLTVTVVYDKRPAKRNKPNKPNKFNKLNHHGKLDQMRSGKNATATVSTATVATNTANETEQKKLPQTSEHANVGLIGLIFLGLAALLGFGAKGKRGRRD